ncbi:MAG: nucleotidyltransferase domain-containing protein [Anaerolineae bacterium]|nr:nucleotidyltransferase domain-containing protein [Anaerolineae bacterium]
MQMMNQALAEIVACLIERYQPQRIILYGSLAYGTPHHDSDIDLLIIKETPETPVARRIAVRQLVQPQPYQVPFSPLVLTPAELNKRLAMGDPFYQAIVQQGRVLYANN